MHKHDFVPWHLFASTPLILGCFKAYCGQCEARRISIVRVIHNDPRVSLSVLHPDPGLRPNAWIWGAEDDVADAVAPTGAAVSSVPARAPCQPLDLKHGAKRRSPRMLVEAENDVLRGLTLAPLVTMICNMLIIHFTWRRKRQ